MMIYDKYKLFQSTLLQEERHKLPGLSVMNRYISIHAPTRGATGISKTTLNDIEFQSTLLQEERPVFWFLKPPIKDFNPRSYKRSDFSDQLKAMDGLEFQSTLLQEERPVLLLQSLSHVPISIHAPTRGATVRGVSVRIGVTISIHAPTRGAT